MSLVKCEENDIKAIAEAIRSNPNFANTFNTFEMPTAIEDYAEDYWDLFHLFFENHKQFNINKLPDSLTKIKYKAFSGCSNLNLIELPENLQSIKDFAFLNCTNLALTELPKNLKSIGQFSFEGCSSLTNLTFTSIPDTLSTTVFVSCPNLITINVPWSENEIANAPWGATNATINYNCNKRSVNE